MNPKILKGGLFFGDIYYCFAEKLRLVSAIDQFKFSCALRLHFFHSNNIVRMFSI